MHLNGMLTVNKTIYKLIMYHTLSILTLSTQIISFLLQSFSCNLINLNKNITDFQQQIKTYLVHMSEVSIL